MSGRLDRMRIQPYTVLRALIIAAFLFVILNSFIIKNSRTVRNDIIQGILLGVGLAFVTLPLLARLYVTKVNGWTTIFGLGVPRNGMLKRAACAQAFPGPVTIPEEAMYWTTSTDGSGHALSGAHEYIMHFPEGKLPPNDAFWSLTMADARQRFVANPLHRYNVGDHSGLVRNADGSTDIYIQRTPPTGHESNWLPAPTGAFILWLRVYEPGQEILDRDYDVPPVVEAKPGTHANRRASPANRTRGT